MDKKLTWVEGLLLLTCFAAAFAVIYMTCAHYYPGEKHGDTATWVGAAGAFLAFGGTIWIATSDNRQKEQEQLVLARVTAATVLDVVLRMKHEIGMAHDAAVECRTAVISLGNLPDVSFKVSAAIAAIESVPTIPRDVLRDLVPAGQRMTLCIAGAQGGLFNCLGLLKAAQRQNDTASLMLVLDSIVDRLGVSTKLIDAAEKDINRVTFKKR